MSQPAIRCLQTRSIMLLLLGCITGGICKDSMANDRSSRAVHGPEELLQESLVQSADESRLLNAAARLLNDGERAEAFQALREVFSRPHDSFTPVIPDRPVESTYTTALKLLLHSDQITRTAWNETVQPEAARALQNALAGKSGNLREVSRRFPLTEAGLNAMLARALLALSRGSQQQALEIFHEIQTVYGSTTLPFAATTKIQSLRKCLNSSPETTAVFADQTNRLHLQHLSVPWNRALWHYEENTWNYPEAVGTLGGLLLPENRDNLTVNNWRPVLSGDTLIFRSPVAISAFRKITGEKIWSVATDSLRTEQELSDAQQQLSGSSRVSPRDLLKMADFSTVTVRDNRMFFVDHFRRFTAAPWSFQDGFQIRRPAAGQMQDIAASRPDGGTRLVAMEIRPEPKILWTAGSTTPFEYQIRHHSSGNNSGVRPSPAPQSDAHFENHRFLGTPLAHGQRLYVLSSDRELVQLNCLSESTGRSIWQRPLLYEHASGNMQSSRFLRHDEQKIGAAICGVDGQTIISALKNGVLVGTSVVDGHLKWATNLTDEINPTDIQQRQMDAFAGVEDHAIGFPPRISEGRIIWAAAEGSYVHCVDSQSGQILWKVPRAVISGGLTEGSRDEYVANITADRAIMVGTRHIRALSLTDGNPVWTTPVQQQTGFVTCNNQTCLVPQQDGTVAAVELKTGQTSALTGDVFDEPDDIIGSLAADGEVVCAATPLSVSVFPSTSVRVRQADAQKAADDILRESQLLVLNGEPVAALSALQRVLKTDLTANQRTAASRFAANTVIRLLAGNRYGNKPVPEEFWPLTSLLDDIVLTEQQILKRLLLQPNSVDPSVLSLTEFPLVELDAGWSPRLDVAAWTSLSRETAGQLTRQVHVRDPLLRKIELATHFPHQLGDADAQLAFAQSLIQSGSYAAAEMVLLGMWAQSTPDQMDRLKHHVELLRNHTAKKTVPHAVDPRNWSASDIEFEETLALTTDSRIAEILAAGTAVLSAPLWYEDRLFTVRRQLFSLDLNRGAVPLPSRLPADVETDDLPSTFEAPGILPIHDFAHVGAVSLVDPEGPELLWWKRLDRPASDASPLEVGPVGHSHFLVATTRRLYCLHPLTGATLWQREIHAAAPAANLFQRTPRLLGDGQVVGLPGRNLQTCEVFRTSSGEKHKSVELNIPHGQIPLMSGRRILFQDEQRLKLRDILTDRDLLADKTAVTVMAGGQAKLLSNHRAIFITDKVEVVVLNMKTAEVEIRTPIGKFISEQRLTGLSAFERNGRLYVVVKDWGDPRAHLSASSRMGEQRIDFGTLFCIDPDSGEVCWHIPAVPSVMPRIYGDPTTLLVTWSWKNPERQMWQIQLQGGPRREAIDSTDQQTSLIVRLLDGQTGRVIAEQHHLSPAEPIRCVHNADDQTIRLESDKSVITIHYPD